MKPGRNLALFLHRSGSIYYVMLDMQGRYTYVNELYRRIFLTASAELTQEYFETSVCPDDRPALRQAIDECLKEPGNTVCVDLRRMPAHGNYVWIGWELAALVEGEQVTGIQAFGIDANERKRAELERQRLITEATIMAQEKERAEIGRELHDNINQILTTTKMYLDMALTEKDISEELTIKSHENISTAIEEIRSLSKSLVPPSLGDIGLKEAVQEMVDNLKLSQKINVRLTTSGLAKASIPGNIKLTVFRIIQEQMNNVLKHSKATEVEIRLTVSEDGLRVRVSDNGVGFDPRRRMKGIGLMNITSRAEVHNGDVGIETAPGNGCTLNVCIPI